MTDDLHPNAEELQAELREQLREKSELDLSKKIWLGEIDQPRGILTNADRKYLAGQKEYEHSQTEANRKQKIRQRTVIALQDYIYLTMMMSEEERTKIFEDELDQHVMDRSLEWMITFLYLGIDGDLSRLERIIENGVYNGENMNKLGKWSGEAYDVDASVSVKRNPDLADLVQKLDDENGDELTPAEIGVLVRSGKIDQEDLAELEDTSLPYLFGRSG